MSTVNNTPRKKAIQRTILICFVAFFVYLIPLLLSLKAPSMEDKSCKEELQSYIDTEKFIMDQLHVKITSLTELITAYNKEEKANTNLETDITNQIVELKRLISENDQLPENYQVFLKDVIGGFAIISDAYKSLHQAKGEVVQKESMTQLGNEALHACQQSKKILQSRLLQCQENLNLQANPEELTKCRNSLSDCQNEINRIITLAKDKGIRIRRKN